MKKLLLLQARDYELAENELDAIVRYGGIGPENIRSIQMNFEDFDGINPSDYHAIMIGGGPYDVSKPEIHKPERQIYIEKTLFKILKTVYENDIPYLGLCYGLGILVKANGGTVSPDFKEDVAPIRLNLTTAGKNDDLLSHCNNAEAIVGHHEGVDEIPADATLLASSENCPVQAIRIKNNIYGTQFHPELDAYGLSCRLEVYKHHGYFAPEEYDEIIRIAEIANLNQVHKIIERFCQKYCY